MTAEQHHELRAALAQFVTANRVRDGVRPEIAASWQRSVAAELEPDRKVDVNSRVEVTRLLVERHGTSGTESGPSES